MTCLPDLMVLQQELQSQIDQDDDYENALNTTRRWVKEKQFRIGVHLLRRVSNADEAAIAYSDVAEVCLRTLFPVVCKDFSRRYGPPPGKGAVVLALGKLGSREMTATSDLDLIVIYDAQGLTVSSGKKPLAISTYFARLTQALLSALTAPMSEGALYEVDMRLRPSGRQGAVATSFKAFAEYQKNEAWTWEHLALSRARVVAGSDTLTPDVEAAVIGALTQPHAREKVIADVQEMREKLENAKAVSAADPWDVKTGAGRLMDIELLLQTGAILHGITDVERPVDMLPELVTSGWVSDVEADEIRMALTLFTEIQQASRLAVEGTFDPEKAGQGFRELLVKVAGVEDIDALETLLMDTGAQMAGIIDARLHT